MPTPGQQALADGFAELLVNHGQVYVRTSDSAAVSGVPAKLMPTSPNMVQSNDREFAILVAASALSPPVPVSRVMPVAVLKKADELTKGTRFYRVVRADLEEGSAMWRVILSPSF